MNYLVAVAFAVIGAACGPFLRAAIFRQSVASRSETREHCPRCATKIISGRLNDHLPSSGRCPSCGKRVGPPAATVELVAAIVLGVLAWRVQDPAALLALSWTGLVGVALSYIDAGVRRLPNRMVFIALAGSAASLTVGAVVSGHYAQLGTAVLCATGTCAAKLALALLPRGLGLGDVKLSFVTGMLAGWFGAGVAVMAFALSLLLLWLAGIASLVMRREGPRDIAHGPLILLGLLIAVCLHG